MAELLELLLVLSLPALLFQLQGGNMELGLLAVPLLVANLAIVDSHHRVQL